MNLGPARVYQIMSILLTMNKHHLFYFVHAEHNLIKLKLYLVLGECYVKFKQTNQICSPLKISQLTLNKAHVIEITKACTVAFMKARNSLVFRCKEELVNWKKITENGGKLFVKASNNRFLINMEMLLMVQQSCLWPTFYQLDFIKR